MNLLFGLVPLATFISVVGMFVLQVLDRSRRNRKEDERDRVVAQTAALVVTTHDLVNSISERKDIAQKGQAFAEGKAAGVVQERASAAAAATADPTA